MEMYVVCVERMMKTVKASIYRSTYKTFNMKKYLWRRKSVNVSFYGWTCDGKSFVNTIFLPNSFIEDLDSQKNW